MNKPNILFYFTDQQRADTCGCYGQQLDVTPRLDAFAGEGVRFSQAFTCQPVCGPARASLQSGMWPTQVGCHVNGIALPTDIPTIAKSLHAAGYQTAYCGKWHLASTTGAQDYTVTPIPEVYRGGWEDYWVASDVLEFTSHGYGGYLYRGDGSKYSFDGYRADAVTDAALEFLRGHRDPARPFVLFLSHIEPHHQNDRNRYEGPEGSKERFANYTVPGDLEGTEGDWRENYPDYLGQCNSCDANFGRLLDELQAQGVLDDTLVVYTSDHGSHFRTRNAEYKRSCHDACTHIPLVIRGPGFRGGVVNDHMVSLIDLPVTLLQAAGAEHLPGMAGRPLQNAMEEGEWDEQVYMQISESHVGRAIRTPKWKYAVGAPQGDGWKDAFASEYYETYLYDLQADPHEKNNLVADPAYRGVRAQLRTQLLRAMLDAGEPSAIIHPECDEAYLQAIGKARHE